MKIRNGFVSNSSSSSFILAYNKEKVLTGAKEIVDFIDENPDEHILIDGGELGEGEDLFEPTYEQKKEISVFRDDFIKKSDIVEKYNYTSLEYYKQPIKAYYDDYYLENNEDSFFTENNDYEAEKKKHIEKALSNVKENAEYEEVSIDNLNSADYDEDFASRYLTDEWCDNYYEAEEMKHYKGKYKPFAIEYVDVLVDKNKILEEIKKGFNTGLLIRYNKKIDYDKDYVEVYAFEIGDKKRKMILDHQDDFLNNKNEIYYYIAATISNEVIENSRKVSLQYGRYAVIDDNKCLKIFKEDFLKVEN